MNKIDELSRTMTTAEVVHKYKKGGYLGMRQLEIDMATCSKGNRMAIEEALCKKSDSYLRPQIERPIDENVDITNEMLEG